MLVLLLAWVRRFAAPLGRCGGGPLYPMLPDPSNLNDANSATGSRWYFFGDEIRTSPEVCLGESLGRVVGYGEK